MYLRALLSAMLPATLLAQTPAATTPPADPIVIEGKVTNATTGEKLRKATVRLMPSNNQQSPYAATSDAEGAFRFENVEPGSYRMSAERQGYVNTQYGARRQYMVGTILKVVAGQKLTGLKVTMLPNATISGKVLDEDGDPMGRVMVRVYRYAFQRGKWQLMPTGGANSDESGEFKASNLSPGKYYLSAMPLRMGPSDVATRPASGKPVEETGYVETYYPSSLDAAGAAAIEVAAGQDAPSSDIRMRKVRVFHVRGKVLSGGQPAHDVRLTMTPRTAGGMGFVMFGGPNMVQSDGKFDLGNVRAGSYDLLATNAMGMMHVQAVMPVDVGDGNLEGVIVNVMPPAPVSGKLVVEGDATTLVSDKSHPVRVYLSGDGIPMGNAMAPVKEDGSFTLDPVSAVRMRVSVTGGPENSYVKSIRWNDQEVVDGVIDLSAGVGGTPVITLSTKAGQIDGGIVSDKPAPEKPASPNDQAPPAPPATVVLVPEPPQPESTNLYKVANADQTGHFSLKGIRPGRYKLYAWEDIDYGAWTDPEVIKYFDGKGVAVTISEGSHESASLPLISAEAVGEQRAKTGH